MRRSERSSIAPFYVMEVMAAAERRQMEGAHVLHLEVGQPSTSAPQKVRAAAHHAIDEQRLGYGPAMGLEALRERISQYYADRHDLAIPVERVAVTAGASAGFVLSLLACFDSGQRVGLAEPGYAAYRNIIRALDLELVPIPVGPHNRYVPSAEDLATAAPLAGLVLASPSNPTGTTMTEGEQRNLVEGCAAADITLIADEIYHRISYGGPAPTMLNDTDDCVVIQSFSKYYSMTGWRLGWMVMPDELIEPITRLAQNLFICPPVLSQHAALLAFDASDELDSNVRRYATNRDVVLGGLARSGLRDVAPADGAFYAWVNVEELGMHSAELSARWLDELAVAVTPGIDFDGTQGHNFIRISYSESTEDVTEAMERIVGWVEDRA